MAELMINLEQNSYPVYIEGDYRAIGNALPRDAGNKLIVITDTNVEMFQYPLLERELSLLGMEVKKYTIPAGEAGKNLDTVKRIYSFLMEQKLDRSSIIAALGGGVTGDITGFAAATFLRGIRYIQIPTTLLSQADSSVGGKTGVDFEGSKNMIGAFHQPASVYINYKSLKTLPKREISSGLAETIKHGLISSREFFYYMDRNMKGVFSFDSDILEYMTRMNCIIKGEVVARDEKESGLRAVLNLGHTIGHAVETVSDFTLTHGESVAIGIAGAFRMSYHLGSCSKEDMEQVENTLVKASLPVRFEGLDIVRIYEQMFYDKKAMDGRLKFIIPEGTGRVKQMVIEDRELIIKVLNELSITI